MFARRLAVPAGGGFACTWVADARGFSFRYPRHSTGGGACDDEQAGGAEKKEEEEKKPKQTAAGRLLAERQARQREEEERRRREEVSRTRGTRSSRLGRDEGHGGSTWFGERGGCTMGRES